MSAPTSPPPSSSSSSSSGNSIQSYPNYFLVRPTSGNIVPLIPADELPAYVNLVGVSRAMEIEETVGMLNLGLVQSSGSGYALVEKGGRCEDGEDVATDGVVVHVGEECSAKIKPPAPLPAAKSSTARTSHAATPSTPITGASQQKPLNGNGPQQSPILESASMPAGAEQQVCRYWAMTSQCRWGNNCHYQHEMPLTAAGLTAAGLTDWPVWYRNSRPWLFERKLAAWPSCMPREGLMTVRGHRREDCTAAAAAVSLVPRGAGCHRGCSRKATRALKELAPVVSAQTVPMVLPIRTQIEQLQRETRRQEALTARPKTRFIAAPLRADVVRRLRNGVGDGVDGEERAAAAALKKAAGAIAEASSGSEGQPEHGRVTSGHATGSDRGSRGTEQATADIGEGDGAGKLVDVE
ncbi:MAG: hypothetical protein M1818_007503 [Claussenomyces sp. TS43310]|nr:MAG: hypothetical protein M1818_007503 [Claussenomyces sp. TS43310]